MAALFRKRGPKSLPWTVYSLKIPELYDIYVDLLNVADEYHKHDEEVYIYLLSEAFLVFQAAFKLDVPLSTTENENYVIDNCIANSVVLARHYFRSGTFDDLQKGIAVILCCDINLIDFVGDLKPDLDNENVRTGLYCLLKEWMEKKKAAISEQQFEFIIELVCSYKGNIELALLLLSNHVFCQISGHKSLPYFEKCLQDEVLQKDSRLLYVLAILYSQADKQQKVLDVVLPAIWRIESLSEFISVVSHHWVFLFDQCENGKFVNFSELACLLMEHMPAEISHTLTKLIEQQKFPMSDIVPMLLNTIPCRLSVLKGHLVLKTLLELIFSSKIIEDYENPSNENCVKILTRIYLSQLRTTGGNEIDPNFANYKPIVVDKMPIFLSYLPELPNVSYLTVRRLQEIGWSKMLSIEAYKEIVNTLEDDDELKLNIECVLCDTNLLNDIIKLKYYDFIIPYTKVCFNSAKHWNTLLLKFLNINFAEHEKVHSAQILSDILDHLAATVPVEILSSLLEPIPLEKDLYNKCISSAQRITDANDIREFIMAANQNFLELNNF